MAEYIDREEAKSWVADWLRCDKYWNPYSKGKNIPTAEVFDMLSTIPAADVHPVQWIPVTERLPEKKGNYLVVFDCGHGAEVHEAFFFKYFDSWEWYDPVEEYQKYNPSHWMPLPEPPKDGES